MVVTSTRTTDLESGVGGNKLRDQRFGMSRFSLPGVALHAKRLELFGVVLLLLLMLMLLLVLQRQEPLLLSELLFCKLQPPLHSQQLPL